MALPKTHVARSYRDLLDGPLLQFDPAHPDFQLLRDALFVIDAGLTFLIQSLEEDERLAGQVQPMPVGGRGPLGSGVD